MSKLIILRGNSGSGKSTVALEIVKNSKSKIAIIDADHYRQAMLFPKPVDKDDLAALMRQDVLYCLDHDYNVIWDSIFYANERNKAYLGDILQNVHPKDNFIFNFDTSLEETMRRHAERPKSNHFTAEEMKEWYQAVEPLGYEFEHTIPENYSVEQTVGFIQRTSTLS